MNSNANQITRHHLYPQSKWGKNVPDNINRITRKYHERIHHLFENLTPVEQLQIVLEDNIKCLRKEFAHKVKKLIELKEDYQYKDWIYVPR